MPYDLRWRLALHLQAGEAACDPSLLSVFRDRLLAGGQERLAFAAVLELLVAEGWVARRSKQRLDSTHVCGLLARTPARISLPFQHIFFWGGLRGALGLALALSLPRSMPYRDTIVIAAFGVVAFSVIVQGITMPLLLKRLSLLPPSAHAGKET